MSDLVPSVTEIIFVNKSFSERTDLAAMCTYLDMFRNGLRVQRKVCACVILKSNIFEKMQNQNIFYYPLIGVVCYIPHNDHTLPAKIDDISRT